MANKQMAGKRHGRISLIGRTTLIAAMCIVLGGTAEARPRLFRMLGILAAPMGAIAGGIHARAHHSRRHPDISTTSGRRAEKASQEETTVFWPTAFNDLFGYTLGDPQAESRFWAHDYGDVIGAMFATSQPVETARARRVAMRDAASSDAQNTSEQGKCAVDPAAADNVIQRLSSTTQPTAEQAASLESLRKALIVAYDRIQSACPASTKEPGARLDALASRLRAMRQAAIIVLTPLRQFYATLSDEQKARLEGPDSEKNAATMRAARETKGCGASDSSRWPGDNIMRRLSPKPEQAKDFKILEGTSAYLSDFVARSCVSDRPETAPERLETALKRINVMRYAVTHVSPSFDEFYYSLSPTQKSRLAAHGR